MNNKNITCNTCHKRIECKALCDNIIKKLPYDKSYYEKNKSLLNEETDYSIYTRGLSEIETRDARRIIIAILSKDQKDILQLYAKGYTQKEIAERLNVSQSNISQKLDAIKREIQQNLVEILPYIV